MAKNNGTWPVAIAVIIVFIFSFALYAYTFTHFPPVPNEVIAQNGQVLFTKQDIILGKYYFQKYGLMDYGSILGMGGYFGIDFTSYTERLIEDYIANATHNDPINNTTMPTVYTQQELSAIQQYMDPTYYPQNNTIVVSDLFAQAYNYTIQYYSIYLGQNSSLYRLKPDLITNVTIIKYLDAYFTWSALISLLGYTNGFPYMPGLTSPTPNDYYATFAMIGAVFAVGIPLVVYITRELISHWHDPVVKVDLPKPSKTQRIALYFMLFYALGSGVQGLLGAYTFHLYSTANLYGLNLLSFLPFNVSRALHIWLAIYWIALTWVAFGLFVLPYFGLEISKRKMLGILTLATAVALASLFGVWASYLQLIPSPWWFIIGAEGRDVIEIGSLWLVLISALLFYVSWLFYKASKITIDLLKPFARILSYLLAGDAVGIFIGALPIVKPWPYFTEDEFFRWIFVHANVEGFWPGIVIGILVLLLVLQGLLPANLGKAIVTIDAVTEVLTGMIGTAHHYYWTGFPVVWMYIGAVLSILEAIPLGFAMAYVILTSWRNKGQALSQFQKTLITFVLTAGIGGSVGVTVFGAGLINAPIVNYFTHDLQFTMAHAHLAFPLAYGLPSILMWVVAFSISGAFNERDLKWLGRASVIYGIGFYLQALLSLLPLGILQWLYEVKYGFWFIKTITTPDGHIGFWNLPIVQDLIWIRMLGDLTAAAGLGIVLLLMLLRFSKAVKVESLTAQ